MMKVDIISKEHIKPSSPTPPHLKTFNLSALDQLVLSPFIPTILYYPNEGSNYQQALKTSEAVKESLSKTLTHFYPLAGTIKDDLSIDCNDVGAYYAVASVNRPLRDLLEHPEFQLLLQLLPFMPSFAGSSAGMPVTNIQLNVFECGGIAISLNVSHKVVDGSGLTTFLRAWANTATGSTEIVPPNLTAPSVFPAKDLMVRDLSMLMMEKWLITQGKCSTKRFVFDSDAISALKAKAVKHEGQQHPSRVEVVSGLIWKCAIAASEQVHGSARPSRTDLMVNLRRRLPRTSGLADNSLGNIVWMSTTTSGPDDDTTLPGLVENLHESISRVNGEFVEKLQGEKRYAVMEESLKEMGQLGTKGSMDHFLFTSWLKMGFYEIDFGWGTPIWVSGVVADGSPIYVNFTTLMDTKFGDGVEACVNLGSEEMEVLLKNPELLLYVTVDPSPLDINS